MKHRVPVVLLLLSALTLAGCRDPAEAGIGSGPYTSTSGSAPGQELSWVVSTPLHLRFERMNGSVTLVVRMSCGVANVPVSISGDVITPDRARLAESADGCSGPAGDHRAWARTFFTSPLHYSRGKHELVLSNDVGRVTFQDSATP